WPSRCSTRQARRPARSGQAPWYARNTGALATKRSTIRGLSAHSPSMEAECSLCVGAYPSRKTGLHFSGIRASCKMALPMTHSEASGPIVLIDGVCVLCSRWYQFVTVRDKAHRFRFLAIQENEGRAIAESLGIDPDNPTTFILVDGGVATFRSEAGLRILEQL